MSVTAPDLHDGARHRGPQYSAPRSGVRGRDLSAPRGSALRFYLLVYAVAFAVYAVAGWPHTHPPTMDAFYYVDIARNLAHGQGFTENFVWNYLGGTPPLRHPSSAYWLPGLSALLAPALALGWGYRGVGLVMAAVAALCPALASKLGHDLFGTRRDAVTMAGLTLFNGVWFHDWASPDAFVLCAALATTTFVLAYQGMLGRGPWDGRVLFACSGLTAGLAALTRQEGAFLLVAVLVAALVTRSARQRLGALGCVAAVLSFAVALLPWIAHNLIATGVPWPGGGGLTLWMRSYGDFFALHTNGLTARGYASWGASHIIGARLSAAVFTLAIWVALWQVVLIPPLLLGMWSLWRRVELRAFLLYWLLLALALPLAFTVTLRNGTLTHASGALVPFASALIVGGIDRIAGLLARVRRRNPAALSRGLGRIALAWAVTVSLGMAWKTFPAHGDEYTHDARVVTWLHRYNPTRAPVMVLDAPAFAYLDGRPYVETPSDGLKAAVTVARRYGVRYWALDSADALARARIGTTGVTRVADVDGVRVYRIDAGGGRQGTSRADHKV